MFVLVVIFSFFFFFALHVTQCWWGLAQIGHPRTASGGKCYGLTYWLVLVCRLGQQQRSISRIPPASAPPRVSTAGTSAVTHVFPLGAGKLCQTFITFQRVVTGAYRNTLSHFYCTPTTWLVKSYCFLSSKTLLSPLGTDTTQASVGPQRCHMVFSSIRTLLHVRKEQLRDVNENKSELQA